MSIGEIGVVWRTRRELKHKSDGLIFTPIEEPIRTGTHPTMFKWKSQHTVDILWRCTLLEDEMWHHSLIFVIMITVFWKCRWSVLYILLKNSLQKNNNVKEEEEEVYPYSEVPLLIIPNEYTRTSHSMACW